MDQHGDYRIAVVVDEKVILDISAVIVMVRSIRKARYRLACLRMSETPKSDGMVGLEKI